MTVFGADAHRHSHVGMDKYKIVHHDFNHFTLGPPGKAGKPPPRMSFTMSSPESERLPLQPSFNVLLVRPQKPSVLQLPAVSWLLDTWAEALELLRPVLRLGVPESSLRDKCPYWRDDGSAPASAPSLKMQRLMKAVNNEAFGASHRQQQQQVQAAQQQPQQQQLGQQQQQQPQQQQQQSQQQQERLPATQQQQQAMQDSSNQQQPQQQLGYMGGLGGVLAAYVPVLGGGGGVLGGAGGAGGGHAGGTQGVGHEAPGGKPSSSHRRHLTPYQAKEEFVEAVTPWAVLALNAAAWCYLGGSASKPPPGM
ncbi:hypothetical protein Agub_g14065 [Astrephomene gubernaculifera]|uniref:Uncharacterized protein n=1 Tax=Astrephomene gubernaculifera TaxID=47775 RepID=A0AAD3E106_9CHLO|nr:hypothetical protein Agub_g14065 [Astrephomene gubernaculifera]